MAVVQVTIDIGKNNVFFIYCTVMDEVVKSFQVETNF